MGVKRPRNILSGPGRPLADRFPEGWRRALGYSWAVPFEAGTPENRDGISELEGRGNRCLLPIRPGQEGPDRGAKQDGRRQILAIEMANRESRSRWEAFLLALRARGLHGVERGGGRRPCRLARRHPRGSGRSRLPEVLRSHHPNA